MRTHQLSTARCLLLALTFAFIAPALPQTATAAAPGPASERPQGRRIETRTGQAIAHRARQLRARNKGFARAMADMERRGLQLNVENSISFVIVDPEAAARNASGRARPVSFSQDTIIEGDEEWTFYTFNNGNPSSWEGILYVRTPSEESTHSGEVVNLTSEPDYWDVAYEAYYPPDGGSPCYSDSECVQLEQQMSQGGDQPNQRLDRHSFVTNAAYSAASAPSVTVSLWGKLRKIVSCLVAGWNCFTGTRNCMSQGGPPWEIFFCSLRSCMGIFNCAR